MRKTMRMISTLLGSILVLVVGVEGTFAQGKQEKKAVIPFSGDVVCETTQTQADGNRIVNRTNALFYRDGQGRVRRETTLKIKDAGTGEDREYKSIQVSDPSGKQNFSLDPQKRTAQKYPPPVGATSRAGAVVMGNLCGPGGINLPALFGARPETKKESLGSLVIDGRAVEGTRITYPITARMVENERSIEITQERWYSSELQLDLLLKTVDPRHGETTQQITNIKLGEPDPALFEIPPDYTVQEIKLPEFVEIRSVGLGVDGGVMVATSDLRPTILYRERAKYTEAAHRNRVEGTVVLNVVFTAEGRITSIRVVRGLPDGLTEKAIEATQKIRFNPALKDGIPVSVRTNLEFPFVLDR